MERTTDSQGYVNTFPRNIERGTYYNDAHPALYNVIRIEAVSFPTHDSESVLKKSLTR
jgi:hypothetical protein